MILFIFVQTNYLVYNINELNLDSDQIEKVFYFNIDL